MYIGSRKCLGKKNPHNFCNVIDIWVVLSKSNLYSRVDLEKKIINKSKIDKPFLFIITKMVPFVTGGFFFNLISYFVQWMDASVIVEKNYFISYSIDLSMMNNTRCLPDKSDTICCEYEVPVVHAVCENFVDGE